MARICGICKRPPREGEQMYCVRLKEEDLDQTPATEVGLYSCCTECMLEHRDRMARRLECAPEEVTNGQMC